MIMHLSYISLALKTYLNYRQCPMRDNGYTSQIEWAREYWKKLRPYLVSNFIHVFKFYFMKNIVNMSYNSLFVLLKYFQAKYYLILVIPIKNDVMSLKWLVKILNRNIR